MEYEHMRGKNDQQIIPNKRLKFLNNHCTIGDEVAPSVSVQNCMVCKFDHFLMVSTHRQYLDRPQGTAVNMAEPSKGSTACIDILSGK